MDYNSITFETAPQKLLHMKRSLLFTCFLIIFILLPATFLITSCSSTNKTKTTNDASVLNSLPDAGKLIDDKPVGKGWVNLIASLDDWNGAKPYWTLDNGSLHGDYNGGQF